jgi:hypothetical protein
MCHLSADPHPTQKPNHCPTKYLHQYLADEDISNNHPLRMHAGQTPVLYGSTIPLSCGWWRYVKQRKPW